VFDPDDVQVGLGHGQSAIDRLDDRTHHTLAGHRIIFIQSDNKLKIVCRNCSEGREIPFLVKVRPKAKMYLLGEFIVESGQCSRSK